MFYHLPYLSKNLISIFFEIVTPYDIIEISVSRYLVKNMAIFDFVYIAQP